MPLLSLRAAHINRVEVPVAGLPPALDGLRVAQLSDLHCGTFTPERRVDEWVAAANDLGADLMVLTGDYVAWGRAYATPVARALGKLRAPRGVVACMGNHDYFGAGEALVQAFEGHGLPLLRNAARDLGGGLTVAAVDDRWSKRDDLGGALAAAAPGAFTLLLAHDPAQFPEIVAARVPLTLSGHTHAGQFAVPGKPNLNLAKLVTRYTHGVYREGDSTLFVSSGLGTTGPPVRIGTRSEIALLTLRPAS